MLLDGSAGRALDIFTLRGIFTAVVNMAHIVNIKGPLPPTVARILRATPGFAVEGAPQQPRQGAESTATIQLGRKRIPIQVQYRDRLSAATAWQAVHDAHARPSARFLVVAGDSTSDSREILRRHGISLVDAHGNAHVELTGLLVHLEGATPRRTVRKGTGPRLAGKAGVLAQALLLHPDRAWQINDLAREGATSNAFAYRVLRRLETEKIVAGEGSGPRKVRRLMDVRALLDLWAEEESKKATRTQGYVLAQTPRLLVAAVASRLDGKNIRYAITGAAAADTMAPFATSIPIVEVWATANASPAELLAALGSERVSEGANVILLQEKGDAALSFGEGRGRFSVANKYRVYLDLLRDPRRGREQAEHLRKEVIGH